jgi:ubiquitin carboxyl-terminal hydrolase 8
MKMSTLSKFDKHKNKGYTGLVNLGNTCFLNSCVQILNHTYELVDVLNSEKIKKVQRCDIADYAIIHEWMDLRDVMWANTGTVSPNKFVFNVHKLAREKNRELFTGWAQNDMSEFLLFMIECMHNSISRSINMNIQGKTENDLDRMAVECYGMLKKIYSKEYSEIMDMFYGIYVSEILSITSNEKYSYKPEHFFILDIPLPDKRKWVGTDKKYADIYDCLDIFTHFETMEGDNAWFNDKTNEKQDVRKRITFWNFPKVLVISLKRFSHDGETKLNDYIEFPLNNLDLSKYVSGYNASTYVYELFGVCNHIGSVLGGHYTAFARNANNEWIHYNDSTVDILQEENVVTPMAYCLFYRKKNN